MGRRKRGLRHWVVAILARGPRTGAEIMDDMERLSGGWWRPSPGSVYPLLEELAQEGAVRRRDDGRYELAEASRAQMGFRGFGGGPRSASDAAHDLGALASYLEDLARSSPEDLKSARSEIQGVIDRLTKLTK